MSLTSDLSTVDLARTRLVLRSGVRFVPQVYGSELFYHIEDPGTGRYYRVGYTEYVFISLLNGTTTFSEALAITARSQSATALPQQQAMTLYCWLLETKLADFADNSVNAQRNRTEKQNRQPLLARVNPFWIRIPLGRPDRLLKALRPFVGWLLSMPVTLFAVLLMIAAGLQLSAEWERFTSASTAVFAPDNWLWLFVAWIGLKCIHETAHGLACLRYGGSVRESGIILAFLAPLAYVDVTSGWGFSSRWQRIHVAAAGMYVELLLASLAVFGWSFIDSVVLSHLLYNVIVMASVSTLVFNANPLMRFDGYYILSDLLQIPNLSEQSSQSLQHLMERVLFGRQSTAPAVTGRTVWLLRIYGAAAVVWRMIISVSLLIAGSVLFHGAGLLLSIMGAAAWFGMPLWNALTGCRRLWHESPARLFRGVTLIGMTAALIAAALLWLPFPFVATAPGIVELPEGSVVRAGADGFIREIHVTAGEHVDVGEVLLTLENDQMQTDRIDLLLQIQQETIRLQSALNDHDAGLADVARSNLASLDDRLAETALQVAMLEIRAAVSGRVIARNLASRRNTFVNEGQELLIIDAQKPRELRVSISQADFPVAQSQAGATLPVRIGTRPGIDGVLERFTPRASRQLPAPALAATAGGPLAVTQPREDSDRDVRQELTTERFDGVVRLPPETAGSLRRGERGYVVLGLRDESVAAHLFRRFTDWLYETRRLAKQ